MIFVYIYADKCESLFFSVDDPESFLYDLECYGVFPPAEAATDMDLLYGVGRAYVRDGKVGFALRCGVEGCICLLGDEEEAEETENGDDNQFLRMIQSHLTPKEKCVIIETHRERRDGLTQREINVAKDRIIFVDL